MRYLFTAKHWQIFIVLMLGIIAKVSSVDDNEIQDAILSLAGVFLFFLWHLSVSFGLRRYLPPMANINYNLYIVNTVAWLFVYSITMSISDWQDLTLEGMAVVPLIYLGFAFLHFVLVPAKVINLLDKQRPVMIKEYIIDFFLILLFPIGIWWLQPKLNRIIVKVRHSQSNTSQI
jgi:hypothetical protein